MDIFKLGDKILDLLNVIFAFWNNQVSLVFALLGQSPTAFKDGKPWDVIEGLEPVFVAVGSSLVVLFFVIGFCSESIDIREEMRFEVILRILIRLGLAEYLVANNVTIMKAFFQSVGALVGLIAEGDRIELKVATEQAVDDMENIFIVAGFSGHGVMHAPACGYIISSLIAKEEIAINVDAFALRRFENSKSICGEIMKI